MFSKVAVPVYIPTSGGFHSSFPLYLDIASAASFSRELKDCLLPPSITTLTLFCNVYNPDSDITSPSSTLFAW